MAPVKKKNLNPTGLGRAIINQKSKDARRAQETKLYTTDVDSSSRLRSVTQENDLDEFLNTAQLAATDFTAERRNITIVQTPNAGASSAHNPFLLSDEEEKQALEQHKQHKNRLRVPRRPPWTREMTHAQLERQERDAFLEWRRGLAQLQDDMGLLLTPFERNLEVWRQLWRVLERSHLVVQIVDARNPLRFRCEDLEVYVKDVEVPEGEHRSGDGKRNSLLLINKADLLTAQQRRYWADYFDREGIQYAFFSAAKAVALQEARRLVPHEPNSKDERVEGSIGDEQAAEDHGEKLSEPQETSNPPESPGSDTDESSSDNESSSDDDLYFDAEEESEDSKDPRTRVLSVLELEALFVDSAPDLSAFIDAEANIPSKLVVGLVGYPNVGKSSTINSLLGEKKVSVSATPGKTKHFQTIHLSPSIVLCDCPGLVFPQFATTTADLVCDGVLPIDQLREYTAPTTLVVKRIPKAILEATYGLTIRTRTHEDGGDGKVSAEDLLTTYAVARGFARAGMGNPDEARAARYILKDYVNAKLLYCHPPPGVSEDEFNGQAQEYALRRIAKRKRAPITRVTKDADTFIDTGGSGEGQPVTSHKARAIDESFFSPGSALSARPFVQGTARHGQAYSRGTVYPHQNMMNDDGTPVEGRRARIASVLAANGAEVVGKGSKKHFKGNKRAKQRSGKGYD
ncbi:P-loop containing nucleoside triphosphate hydrolase protein [Fomitiporia mediterranea MF3/22]|uniref:P-loop containing nucleoside triphosphate hydrolase protein n=1 Tax=Fomitiporia mediterranea (strain MF3/22) TaxID=694068 RepID=UPI0004408F74|nr:P-loop containing nucleoside triphosphate hydrolase protein [Fomitiporia mediterranea MF3/22]EJD03696.1 P-loop containing nucleoside triphosphate hydrolase protein [Fomitiporia mediterranea MF3/22]